MYTVLFNFLSKQDIETLCEMIPNLTFEIGRQETGYKKAAVPQTDERIQDLLQRSKKSLVTDGDIDAWVLEYPVKSFIPSHKDDAPFGTEHWRLNAVIVPDTYSSLFIEKHMVHMNEGDAVIFRPDLHEHKVSEVTFQTRYIWSVGCLK